MNFRPLGKRMLVLRKEPVSETPGGIIIPDSYKDRASEGEVLEIGEDVEKIKKSEQVMFAKYAGSTIENQEEGDLLVIEEKDVLGVLE